MTDEEMADKHAEEYVMREDVITENDRVPFDNGYGFQTVSFENEVKKGFQDGAEFGYNKANEWHWIKDGDFPEEEKEYLIYTKKKKLEIRKIHISGDGKNYLTDVFLMRDLESVIAWKEIVLPELPKESK